MKHRLLDHNSLKVNPIALGTWAMGASVEAWGHIDDRESIAAIQQAIDLGVNLIDTAPIYGCGHSESIVGKAVRGRRESVLIATKCGLLFPPSAIESPMRCLSRNSLLEECDASLRRLGVDAIDLYQCHWPDPQTPIQETVEALNRLREQGKIRAIGLSNYSVEDITAAREFGTVHCVQAPFSLLHQRTLDDLIPYCTQHRIAFLGYSPLAKGLLTGKFDANSQFEGIRARDPDFVGARYQNHLRILAELKEVAAEYACSLAQLALAWAIAQPGITAAIAGAKRPSQVVENLGSLRVSITESDLNRIGAIARGGDVGF